LPRGVPPQHITVCDTLACLVHEYYDLLHGTFSAVRYEDCAGKFERVKAAPSGQALHWSCRPQGKAQDFLPPALPKLTISSISPT